MENDSKTKFLITLLTSNILKSAITLTIKTFNVIAPFLYLFQHYQSMYHGIWYDIP